jgi:hypothetical protein
MDLRQEIERVFNGFSWYQANLGEVVVWHEYDSSNTEYHNVYDEGGRHYTSGVYLPVLWAIITEGRAARTDTGRKPTETLSLAVSARALDESGVSDPDDYARRLNDVIRYDERLWKVTTFNIRGRIPSSVVIGVTATQVYSDEEMVFDDLPPSMQQAGNHRTVAYPNSADDTFVEHDGPGAYNNFYTDLDGEIILDGGGPSS